MIEKINTLRFKEDNISNYKELMTLAQSSDTSMRMELLANSLKVIPEITPDIFDTIEDIIKKLNVDDISIECYIHNDNTMNASCFSLKDDVNIVVVLNSGLVNALRKEELAFVIGHEIGHYLLGHLNYIKEYTEQNHIQNLSLNRLAQSQEISADRIGFICSGSIENSLRSIIKTVSGLDDKFITRNLHNYLHQLNELDYQKIFEMYNSTHPIFPVRAKALMLFSMTDKYHEWAKIDKKPPFKIETVDKKITEDLELTTLRFETNENKELTEKFKLWFFVKAFTEDGIIDKEENAFLIKTFGDELTQKILTYIRNNPNGVSNKYNEAKNKIEFVSKIHMNKILLEMEGLINSSFDNYRIKKHFEKIKKHYNG